MIIGSQEPKAEVVFYDTNRLVVEISLLSGAIYVVLHLLQHFCFARFIVLLLPRITS